MFHERSDIALGCKALNSSSPEFFVAGSSWPEGLQCRDMDKVGFQAGVIIAGASPPSVSGAPMILAACSNSPHCRRNFAFHSALCSH